MEEDAQMTYMSEPEMAMERAARAKIQTPAKAYPSRTAGRIMESILPRWRIRFLEKNAGYGDMHQELGPRAQFVDINRKAGKLRRALWEGDDIGDEDVQEVAMDIIGHCFLLLDLLDQEGKE